MHGNNSIMRVGLIGAGRMGTRWAEAVTKTPGARLVCVFDTQKKSAEALAARYHVAIVPLRRKQIPWDDLDAVIIVTPHAFLFSFASEALKKGKAVLVEKPGCRTWQEMAQLRSLAQKKRVPFMVGYTYRFFDVIRRAKKIIDDGVIGSLNFMRVRHGHAGRPTYAKEWRMNKRMAGGGVLMDQGVHLLDLIQWFMPGPYRVAHGDVNHLYWKTAVEENAMATIKNQRGQLAQLHVSVTQWKPIFSLELYGGKGYVQVDGLGRKYGGTETVTIGMRQKDGSVKEKKIQCRPDAERALQNEFQSFVTAVRTRQQPQPNAKDGLAVLRLVEAIYHSANI